MEESEAIQIIRNCLKKHPRWDPLRREPAEESYDITLNDINFVVYISDKGFEMDFIFNNQVDLRSMDGKKIISEGYRLRSVLEIPQTGSDVLLIDPNPIWNDFISIRKEYLRDAEDVEGAHFFNVWMTFGNNGDDDETRYPATNISLTKSKITFTAQVPKGFRNIRQCNFFIQGANRNVFPFLTINPRGAEGLANDNVWVMSQSRAVLINDLDADTISVTVPQSTEIKAYILSVFQHCVYQNETIIRTFALGRNQLRIFPLQFCTNLASAVNTTLKVIFQDDEERVRLNPIYGLEAKGKPWRRTAPLRLPIISLKRQTMIILMKRLRDLEDIPIIKRTIAQWSEIEKLTKIIRTSSEIMVIDCVVCSNVATLLNEQTRKPYCSKKCAQKDEMICF